MTARSSTKDNARKRIATGRKYAGVALIAGAAVMSGCGGGGTGTTHVRAVNLIPNSTTAALLLGGGSWTGNQAFEGASGYVSLFPETTAVSVQVSAQPSTAYPTTTRTLSGGTFYTGMLAGLANVTSSADARYPKVIWVTESSETPTSGNALIRFVHAAPDAATADILVNSATMETGDAYSSVGAYTSVAAGLAAIEFDSTGTTTAIASKTATLTAGHLYTAYLVETATTPTYSVFLADDTR